MTHIQDTFGALNIVWACGNLSRADLLIGAWDIILVRTWLHKMHFLIRGDHDNE